MGGVAQTTQLGHGAWCRVEPLLSGEQASALLARMLEEIEWERRAVVLFGREIMQPRQIAWAGELEYRYSGQTLPIRAWPPCLVDVWKDVRARAGVEFNHVLCNRYQDGRDHMGFHADDEPELGPEPTVSCVSLGAERAFVFRSRTRGSMPQPKPSRHTLTLPVGSLFTMGGTFQHRYLHALPPRRRVQEPRLSLTFRRLLRPPRSRAPEGKGQRRGGT